MKKIKTQFSKKYPVNLCFKYRLNQGKETFRAFHFEIGFTFEGFVDSRSGFIINRDLVDKVIKSKIKKLKKFYFNKSLSKSEENKFLKNDFFIKELFLEKMFSELKKTDLKNNLISVFLKTPIDLGFEIRNH